MVNLAGKGGAAHSKVPYEVRTSRTCGKTPKRLTRSSAYPSNARTPSSRPAQDLEDPAQAPLLSLAAVTKVKIFDADVWVDAAGEDGDDRARKVRSGAGRAAPRGGGAVVGQVGSRGGPRRRRRASRSRRPSGSAGRAGRASAPAVTSATGSARPMPSSSWGWCGRGPGNTGSGPRP
jgi:hypothetical protein